MVIGNRLKELRESKQLSQGDVEKRTGFAPPVLRAGLDDKRTITRTVSTFSTCGLTVPLLYPMFHGGHAHNISCPSAMTMGIEPVSVSAF